MHRNMKNWKSTLSFSSALPFWQSSTSNMIRWQTPESYLRVCYSVPVLALWWEAGGLPYIGYWINRQLTGKSVIQFHVFTFDELVLMCARCPYHRCVHASGRHGNPTTAAVWPTGWNPTVSTQWNHHQVRFCPVPSPAKLWHLLALLTGTRDLYTHTHYSFRVLVPTSKGGDNKWLLPFCRMADSFSVWSVQRLSSQLLPWTNGALGTDRGMCWQVFTSTTVCGRTVRPPPLDSQSATRTMTSWASQVGRDALMLSCAKPLQWRTLYTFTLTV